MHMYIYIYSFSRHFYPKRLTSEEYNKQYATSNAHNSSPSVNILSSEKLHVCNKHIYIKIFV